VFKGGAALNDANRYDNTLLMSVEYGSNLEVPFYFTELDVDIDIPNYFDDNGNHVAALSVSVDMIKLLLHK
jgi:ankyrin repeat protein